MELVTAVSTLVTSIPTALIDSAITACTGCLTNLSSTGSLIILGGGLLGLTCFGCTYLFMHCKNKLDMETLRSNERILQRQGELKKFKIELENKRLQYIKELEEQTKQKHDQYNYDLKKLKTELKDKRKEQKLQLEDKRETLKIELADRRLREQINLQHQVEMLKVHLENERRRERNCIDFENDTPAILNFGIQEPVEQSKLTPALINFSVQPTK